MANRVQTITALGGLVAEAKAREDANAVTVLSDAIAALVEAEGELAGVEQRRARDRARKAARVQPEFPRNPRNARNSTESPLVSPPVLSPGPPISTPPFNPPTLNAAMPLRTNGAKPRRSKAGRPHSYTPEFEAWWQGYPAEFRGSKHPAFEQWWRRLSEGHKADDITAGRDRYIAHCRALDRHLKHASTFLGPELHFAEPWPLPTHHAKPAVETDDQRIARVKRMSLAISARRDKADGDEWWAWVESEAREQGAKNAREVLEFAYRQLTPEVAHA